MKAEQRRRLGSNANRLFISAAGVAITISGGLIGHPCPHHM